MHFLGLIQQQKGNLREGEFLLRQALALREDASFLYNLGNLLRESKRLSEAEAVYRRALELKPDYAAAQNNLGLLFLESKRLHEAETAYRRVVELKPGDAVALVNLGNLLNEAKRTAEADAAYRRALELKPDYAEAHYNFANLLQETRHLPEAEAAYRRALALKPDFAEAHNNLGHLLIKGRRLPEAEAACRSALELKPDCAETLNNFGNLLKETGRLSEAEAAYRRALELRPDYAEAHYDLGNLLTETSRLSEAEAAYRRALDLKPALPYLLGSWFHTKMQLCDWDVFDDASDRLIRAIESGENLTSPSSMLAISSSSAQQQQCAGAYAQDRFPASSTPVWRGERYRHGRIRLGYFSGDFRDHPVAHVIAELLERHDRSRFEIVGYSFGQDTQDPWRRRLEGAFDQFLDVAGKTDHEIAGLAREMEIDIAVDLMGFTQHCRTGIFALRPSPIQVNYLGYPGTSGTEYIDYIMADAVIIPPEHRTYYTEQVVCLPGSYFPSDSTKAISERHFSRAELGLPEDGFVFCCFNSSGKITPDAFDIWMRLLKKVEGSVLWLSIGNATAIRNLRTQAEMRGVAPERLIFSEHMQLSDHFARHRQADLFLDTFYYNAHTTASNALWAGLPVLTCLGNAFAGRVAASLLTAVGLPELIANSHEEYESLALELATCPEELASIRRKLAETRTTKPLFDTPLYTRHLEAAYQVMYERFRAGLAPDQILVEP